MSGEAASFNGKPKASAFGNAQRVRNDRNAFGLPLK